MLKKKDQLVIIKIYLKKRVLGGANDANGANTVKNKKQILDNAIKLFNLIFGEYKDKQIYEIEIEVEKALNNGEEYHINFKFKIDNMQYIIVYIVTTTYGSRPSEYIRIDKIVTDYSSTTRPRPTVNDCLFVTEETSISLDEGLDKAKQFLKTPILHV